MDDLPDPDSRILRLLNAWKAARHGGAVPRKTDFEPHAIPQLLSKIWLYGLEPDGSDFTCRLAGEDINRTWGGSIAGRAAKTLFGADDHRIIAEIWHAVLETPLIHYGKAEKLQGNEIYAAERIVLPLRGDDADSTKGYVLGMSLYALDNLDKARPERILTNAFHIHCADIR